MFLGMIHDELVEQMRRLGGGHRGEEDELITLVNISVVFTHIIRNCSAQRIY
jgi:hypothetical protein